MTEISLPSGAVFDFGNLSQKDIAERLTTLRGSNPELFQEEVEKEGPPDPATTSYEDLKAYYSGRSSETEKVETTHEGEVKDLGLQYFVGRGDTDEERQTRLVSVFGKEGITKVGADDFVLNLDSITEEVKEKYNLPESGTIRFNEPGLGWQDVAAFLGRETVPLVSAVGASIAATGVGAPAGVALVALAGAAGKAVDEFIIDDIFEGLQKQNTGEILTDVAIQGLIEGTGEFAGRGIVAGLKWALKGRGPQADSVRVAELRENYINQGYSAGKANRLATKAAREETAAMYRKMIEGGANIPAVTLTGKSILGRTQAIWESIFPNDAAVARNVDYVNNILKQHSLGNIQKDEAKRLITETGEAMAAKLERSMADPDKALVQANKELKSVLEKEFNAIDDVLKRTTAGSEGLASEFQRGLELASKLFTARSNQLYRNADSLLKDQTIDVSPLQSKLKSLQSDRLRGGETLKGGIFKYIQENPQIKIADIPALRSALRASEGHPDLLGTTAGRQVKELLDALDASVLSKQNELAEMVAKALPSDPPARVTELRKGLELLTGANQHYKEGAEIINSGLLNQINQQIKDKNIVDMSGIVDLVVRNNQPNLLKFVLDSVTPTSKEANVILQKGQEFPGLFRQLEERILNGEIREVNSILENVGLGASSLGKAGLKAEKNMLTVPDTFAQLPKNDPTRIRLQKDFAETLRLYDEMSNALRGPNQFRDGYRQLIAKNWLDDATKLNTSDDGINYRSLVSSFDSLGTKVQNELFGEQAGELRRVMGDMKLLDKSSVKQLDGFVGDIANQDARLIVDTFKNVVRQSEAEAQDSFLRAMRGGPIEVDKLVTHVLKNPKNFDTLRSRVGDEFLDSPGGFKDLVLERIVSSGFPTGRVDMSIVRSGAFGQAWLKSMKDMNKSGALNKVLGEKTVKDLENFAKVGETISDSVLKGKTGLAAAGYAAGFAGALYLNPIAALTGAAGILVLSRALRSPAIMKVLTSPRLRAYEAKKAIQGGADLGPRNLAAERAIESAFRSLRTILVDMGYYSADQGSNIVEQEIIQPAVEQVGPAAQQIAPAVQQIRQQVGQQISSAPPNPNQQIAQLGPDALRQLEQEKLLGVA